MELSDEELVELTQQGSRAAYASLIDKHKTTVYNMAFRVVGKQEDAEEIAQDAFVRAFRALASFRQDAKFSTWLYRITMNVALTKARKNRVDVVSIDASLDEDEDTAPLQIADTMDNPEEQFSRKDFQDRVRALISALPPKYSAVLTMYHMQDLSYEEISESLELPIGTVKAHLFRARNALKKLAIGAFDPEELQ